MDKYDLRFFDGSSCEPVIVDISLVSKKLPWKKLPVTPEKKGNLIFSYIASLISGAASIAEIDGEILSYLRLCDSADAEFFRRLSYRMTFRGDFDCVKREIDLLDSLEEQGLVFSVVVIPEKYIFLAPLISSDVCVETRKKPSSFLPRQRYSLRGVSLVRFIGDYEWEFDGLLREYGIFADICPLNSTLKGVGRAINAIKSGKECFLSLAFASKTLTPIEDVYLFLATAAGYNIPENAVKGFYDANEITRLLFGTGSETVRMLSEKLISFTPPLLADADYSYMIPPEWLAMGFDAPCYNIPDRKKYNSPSFDVFHSKFRPGRCSDFLS